MTESSKVPAGGSRKGDKVYNSGGELVEFVDGKWLKVWNEERLGWWRYHDHYDHDGYCDNPARGY